MYCLSVFLTVHTERRICRSLGPEGVTNNFVFGHPCDFKINVLPTRRDVVNYLRKVHAELSDGSKRSSVRPTVKLVVDTVVELWLNEGIPTVTQQRVKKMTEDCHRR